ncbi:Hypothetical predicted protein [Olea europaea subsp. europaea]|uniref:Uncharacterized protein n=1 Tax=Olea europaea subsp. europaea TaxID=158383 RepID=A0A8S0UNA8_OLEEU|nr:Hypothetical predicted protein [Olea europaea subsp. europaea]
MASKADLIKIGRDGFALVDEYFGKRRRASSSTQQKHHVPQARLYQYLPEQTPLYQVKAVSAAEEKITRHSFSMEN